MYNNEKRTLNKHQSGRKNHLTFSPFNLLTFYRNFEICLYKAKK